MFKKFITWLVSSSENPSQMALTVKGLIVMGIPWIVTIAGFFHVMVPSADLATVGNSVVILVQATLTAIGAGIAIYGFIRKLINTYFIPWPSQVTALVGVDNVVVKA